MGPETEKIFEGTYQYFQGGQNYSQENFTVELAADLKQYIFLAEILSRVETGEFFKMHVRYVVNQFFVPQTVEIEKSLGEKHAHERYLFDPHNQSMQYTFTTPQGTQTVERPFGTKHHLSAPCFLTSALFTQTKRVDPTARTPVTFVSSPNSWEYAGPPEDKIMFVEFKTHDAEDLVVGGAPLPSSKYEIYEQDRLGGTGTPPTATLWVSRHLGMPYKIEDKDGTQISVRRLKKFKQDMPKI